MIVVDIPTELLLKVRERLLSGRIRLATLSGSGVWLHEIERRMIEVLDDELRRRLH
jgi:hypothetical protein